MDAQGRVLAGRKTLRPLVGAHLLAGSRIERRPVGIARPVGRAIDLAGDVGARAETGVEEAPAGQILQRAGVIGEMFGLAAHRLLPDDAQPGQVLENGGLEIPAAAVKVDIFDSHQQLAAQLGGHALVLERAIGMPQMKIAIGRGREAQDRCVRCRHGPASAGTQTGAGRRGWQGGGRFVPERERRLGLGLSADRNLPSGTFGWTLGGNRRYFPDQDISS